MSRRYAKASQAQDRDDGRSTQESTMIDWGGGPWVPVPKFHAAAARLSDGHYSRRKPGSPQFMPPGQTLVLMTPDELALFGWWRPHPDSGLEAMNGLDGWTCTIFRNTGPHLSSDLILEAERELLSRYDCGPDGLLTYVWDSKVRSANPGYCFKVAGWKAVGRSADGRKTLLQKLVAAETMLDPRRVTCSKPCSVCHQPEAHGYHEPPGRGRGWEPPQHPFYAPAITSK